MMPRCSTRTVPPLPPIAPLADVCLEMGEANFEGFRSMAATMALAMTLTVAVAGKRSERT